MTASPADLETARELWRTLQPGKPFLALLTTASADGSPHATWMGAISAPAPDELLTITSPESLKVKNISENPNVEWIISEMNRKALLYLRGEAAIVEDVGEIKRCWMTIPGKTQAYFLRYFNTAPGFTVIRTRVTEAELVTPEEFRKVRIPPAELVPAPPQ